MSRALGAPAVGGLGLGLLGAIAVVSVREGGYITHVHVEHALETGDLQLVWIAVGAPIAALATFAATRPVPTLRALPDALLDGLDAAVAVAVLTTVLSTGCFARALLVGDPVPDLASHLLQLPDSPLLIAQRGTDALDPLGLAVLTAAAGAFGMVYAFTLFLRGPRALSRARLARVALVAALPGLFAVNAWLGSLLATIEVCSAAPPDLAPAVLRWGFREDLDHLLLGGACSLLGLVPMVPALAVSLAGTWRPGEELPARA